MKNALLAAALFGVLAVGCDAPTAPPPLQVAGPDAAVTTHDVGIPITFVAPACAEDIEVDGRLHVLTTETISADQDTAAVVHVNANGAGTGLSTGASYRWNDVIQWTTHLNGELPVVLEALENLTLVGLGDVPDLTIRARFHLTVNARGVLTASIDEFEQSCS